MADIVAVHRGYIGWANVRCVTDIGLDVAGVCVRLVSMRIFHLSMRA